MKKNINLVVVTVTPVKTTVAFNQHVSKDYVNEHTQFIINDVAITGEWLSCTGNQYDSLWIFKHEENISDDLNIKVTNFM